MICPRATITLTLDLSWNQTRFNTELCTLITNPLVDSISITQGYANTVSLAPLTLPECFWNATSRLRFFESNAPLILSHDDPLLAFSNVDLVSLTIKNATFVNPSTSNGANNGTFTPNWVSFFSNRGSLSQIIITHSNLGGSLPSKWPNQGPDRRCWLDLSYNRITGTLPATLLSASEVNRIVVDLTGNTITGTIPKTLFSMIPSTIGHFYLSFAKNQLSGTIPSDLLSGSPVAGTTGWQWIMDLSSNQLSGALPSGLFRSYTGLVGFSLVLKNNRFTSVPNNFLSSMDGNTLEEFTLDLSFNQIRGSVPKFIDNMPFAATSFAIFDLNHNQLSGTLPSSLVVTANTKFSTAELTWDLSYNSLSGTIPSTLVSSVGYDSITVALSFNALTGVMPASLLSNSSGDLTLYVDHNRLSGPLSSMMPSVARIEGLLDFDASSNAIGGTIPDSFFSRFSGGRYTTDLRFIDCGITGTLPKDLLGGTINLGARRNYNFDHNQLTGSYPWGELYYNMSLSASPVVTISAAYNQLTGPITLPMISYNRFNPYRLSLLLANNQLTSLSIQFPTLLYEIDVSNNVDLQGTVPAQLVTSDTYITRLASFSARNTSLIGDFPGSLARSTTLINLDLSYTEINFCAAWWESAIPIVSCRLVSTNATQCSSKYPAQCRYVDDEPESAAPTYPWGLDPNAPADPNPVGNGGSPDSPAGSGFQASPSTSYISLGVALVAFIAYFM